MQAHHDVVTLPSSTAEEGDSNVLETQEQLKRGEASFGTNIQVL